MSGGFGGIRRWQLQPNSDGQQVGNKTYAVYAISVSRNHRWIVYGTDDGASVWDEVMDEKVFDVEGKIGVWAVDVSPDSTRFATGTTRKEASIWSMTTAQRLVGPLTQDGWVNGLRFSPTGEYIATACLDGKSIGIFDSHGGDKLVTLNTAHTSGGVAVPLAWSGDARQVFAASGLKITAFDVSTGSQIAESQIFNGGIIHSIALAPNGKFIATFASHSIWLLDTSTLARIHPIIENSKEIRSISISPDNSCLATGDLQKIIIRDLGRILPDSYGPFPVSIHSCKPYSVSHADKLYRYLLAMQYNKTMSGLWHRAAPTPKHLTLPR